MKINQTIALRIFEKLKPLFSCDISVSNANYCILQSSISNKISNIEKANKNNLIIPLKDLDETIGHLLLHFPSQTIRKQSKMIQSLAELTTYQALHVDTTPYKHQFEDNLIYRLIHAQNQTETQDLIRQIKSVGYDISRNQAIILIEIENFWEHFISTEHGRTYSSSKKDSIIFTYKNTIAKTLERHFKNKGHIISYLGQNRFIVFQEYQQIPLKKAAEEILKKLKKTTKLDVTIGYTTHSPSLFMNFAKPYRTAKIILQTGLTISGANKVYNYDQVGEYLLFSNLSWHYKIHFIRPLIDKLEKLSYALSTLNSLFENNYNITQTAKKLKLHPNTIHYRLTQIKKKTNLDPNNSMDLFRLQLALTFYHLYTKN